VAFRRHTAIAHQDCSTLPPGLARWLGPGPWRHDDLGCAATAIYRIPSTAFGGPAYLKIGRQDDPEPLARERDVLRWLGDRLPVPQVWGYGEDQTHTHLLLSEIPGLPASDTAFHRDPAPMVRALATGLRQIHIADIIDCPFDQRLAVKMAEARVRVRRGLVDADDFEQAYQGRSAADLYAQLQALRPATEDPVLTHGDYCLPNVLLQAGQVSGFIDWGRAGVADRYQDLALAVRSLRHNLGRTVNGERWIRLFLQTYGLDDPDWEKIAFYILLDEFF
jgi:aminoglycoside phosphotransferase